jgi:hypothetical protein
MMPLQGRTDEPKEIRSGCFSDFRLDPLWNTNSCEKLLLKRDQEGDCEMRKLLFAVVALAISHPPREWAERFFKVQCCTEMSRGGHFAATEEPQRLAEPIRAWFGSFRP